MSESFKRYKTVFPIEAVCAEVIICPWGGVVEAIA
jgi:hypothetical protein